MMSSFADLKISLVIDLWLPLAIEGGNLFFPRLRRNKKMKLLTLTDQTYEEVKAFENEKLIKRDHVVAWTHGLVQKLRLETELGHYKEVLFEGKFDHHINAKNQKILNCLPCNLLNLDFSSQKPERESGRIEREINGVYVLRACIKSYVNKRIRPKS